MALHSDWHFESLRVRITYRMQGFDSLFVHGKEMEICRRAQVLFILRD